MRAQTFFCICLSTFCMAAPAQAQTQVDMLTQTKNVDFSKRPVVLFPQSAALPGTCSTGQGYLVGSSLYVCTGANVWTLQNGGIASAPGTNGLWCLNVNSGNLSWVSCSSVLPSTWAWSALSGVPGAFPPSAHAGNHGLNGSDPISLDASQIATGVLSASRIPALNYQAPGPYASCTGDLSGTAPGCTVHGIAGVPLCSGFTPTNGQMLEYTTSGTPNPCYAAAVPVVVGNSGTANNLAGGSAGQIPYQTAPGTTGYLTPNVASGPLVLDSSGNASIPGAATVGSGGPTQILINCAYILAADVPSGTTNPSNYVLPSPSSLPNGSQMMVCDAANGADVSTGGGTYQHWVAAESGIWIAEQTQGPQGPAGVTAATLPVTYNAGTQTVACPTCAQDIASGQTALGTSAISSGACAPVVTASASGAVTTDVIQANFASDPTGITGYIPSTGGMLLVYPYPTSGAVNFKVCNPTSGTVTPGAVSINWRVAR